MALGQCNSLVEAVMMLQTLIASAMTYARDSSVNILHAVHAASRSESLPPARSDRLEDCVNRN